MFWLASFRAAVGLAAALLAVASPPAARASGYCISAPEEKMVSSANGEFAVRILPGHVDDLELPPSADLAAPPPVERSARAVLYEKLAGGSLQQLATFELLNPLAPLDVLISNDGQRLVTKGDWCHRSRDQRTDIAIYDSDGTVVRAFSSLDLLVDSDSRQLWGGPVKWSPDVRLDDETNRLVLEISGCRRALDCTERLVRAIEIDLADGEPVRPPRQLFAFIAPRVTVHPYAAEEAAPLGDFRDQCPETPAEDVPHLSFSKLSKEWLNSVDPVYTETGKRARLSGRVVLQLSLEHGAVRCVAVLKDLPMGLGEAAREAAKRWSFRPAALGPRYATTTVAVDFAMVDVPPPEN